MLFSCARALLVRRWSWAICTDTCAICRNNLYEPSIEYQANPTGRQEYVVLENATVAKGCEAAERFVYL